MINRPSRLKFVFCSAMLMLIILVYLKPPENNYFSGKIRTKSTGNGTLEAIENKYGYLINTTSCKIPNFPPWGETTHLLKNKCSRYFLTQPNCQDPHSWAYVDGQYLVMNITAVKESGYSWRSIRCCYRAIERVEQTLANFDMNADRQVKYSNGCVPIEQPIHRIDVPFIRLVCTSNSVHTFGQTVYKEFLSIAMIDRTAQEKVTKWKALNEDLPPNIVLLGIDTNSRLNSLRNFKQSLAAMKAMGAIEMQGYTKVGETTFPNTVGFLSGYSIQGMRQFCYETVSKPQDYCPYLYQSFNKVGYLTATIDDAPFGTSFNFLKAGFVNKPTDFYPRPLMLAVMKHMPRMTAWYTRCLGRYQIEQVWLKYTQDILKLSRQISAPVFIHTWFTVMSHECSLASHFGDEPVANFLKEVDKNNTILFFMSDHGEAFGDFRESVQGWYEDKLPTMWIHIPPRLRQKFPDWMQSLKLNSNRLSSPFDLYKTLVHILQTFDKDNAAKDTYDRLSSQKGQSLFQPLDEARTCSDAGVPEGYCACSETTVMDVTDTRVQQGAEVALQFISNMLPEQCEVPVLKEIVEAKYFTGEKDAVVYLISFYTEPGNFLFEGTVKRFPDDKWVVTNDVLRMNKIVRKADCINDSLMERYCYCK